MLVKTSSRSPGKLATKALKMKAAMLSARPTTGQKRLSTGPRIGSSWLRMRSQNPQITKRSTSRRSRCAHVVSGSWWEKHHLRLEQDEDWCANEGDPSNQSQREALKGGSLLLRTSQKLQDKE